MRCLALLTLFAIAGGRRVDYCGARMCGNADTHTFCQYRSGPGHGCIGFIEAKLSGEEKSRLLARLNRRRSEAARGRLRGMQSAGDMMKLRWIEELAKEAQLWANQCTPPSQPEERDECRDLYSISVGQCVASVLGEAPGLRVESMVDIWFMQSLFYKGNVTSYVPPKNDRRFYGDFAQMMWARSYMVGCGRSRFMISRHGRLRSVERLVCNLSPAGPAPARALWSPAAPGAACPPRARLQPSHPALCDYQIEIDESDILNNTMTIEAHVLLSTALEIERNVSLSEIGSLDELYLTNLAIVTMDKVETSPLYNFAQKRDIVEAINVDNLTVKDIRNEHNKTKLKSTDFYNTYPKMSKKKISMIGRPKTYNMAELTEIGGDHLDNYEMTEYVPKNLNDIYGEYVDTQEENETIILEAPHIDKTKEFYGMGLTNHSKTTFIPTPNEANETINGIISLKEENMLDMLQSKIATNGTELNMNITAVYLNKTLESKEKNAEDYLTDPETVRQLQQALDRMEKEKSPKISSKVRRELRDFAIVPEDGSTVPPEGIRNTSPADRSPMINMVMKYMPLFKQYEGEILGSVNSANCVHPSLFLVLFVFVNVIQ